MIILFVCINFRNMPPQKKKAKKEKHVSNNMTTVSELKAMISPKTPFDGPLVGKIVKGKIY